MNGRGEAFVGGGRVVKNVTGFDLPKVLAGSWGTLAALTEVTVRVVPAAESECTLLFGAAAASAAVELCSQALGSDVRGVVRPPSCPGAVLPCAWKVWPLRCIAGRGIAGGPGAHTAGASWMPQPRARCGGEIGAAAALAPLSGDLAVVGGAATGGAAFWMDIERRPFSWIGAGD